MVLVIDQDNAPLRMWATVLHKSKVWAQLAQPHPFRGHGRIHLKTRVKNRKPSFISALNACRCARGSNGQRCRALFSRFVHTLDSTGNTPEMLARIIHEKCVIKAKPFISLTTMRMGCLMKFFAMKSLAQVFGGLGRFRAVR